MIVQDSRGDSVVGDQIEDNAGNGVTIIQARRLTVGGSASAAGNQIESNQGYGISAAEVCSGSLIASNVITGNSQGSVNLTRSRGITYIP